MGICDILALLRVSAGFSETPLGGHYLSFKSVCPTLLYIYCRVQISTQTCSAYSTTAYSLDRKSVV